MSFDGLRCRCKPGFGGLDCSLRTCPGDCSGNGWCYDGTCLCYPEYGGADCNVHAGNKRIPMKCALNCVHGCLGKCSHIYTQDGIGPSRTCYMDCTRKCLPTCVAGTAAADMILTATTTHAATFLMDAAVGSSSCNGLQRRKFEIRRRGSAQHTQYLLCCSWQER